MMHALLDRQTAGFFYNLNKKWLVENPGHEAAPVVQRYIETIRIFPAANLRLFVEVIDSLYLKELPQSCEFMRVAIAKYNSLFQEFDVKKPLVVFDNNLKPTNKIKLVVPGTDLEKSWKKILNTFQKACGL